MFNCKVTGNDANVEIPIFNYKGYKAFDSNGNEYRITDGENRVVAVNLPDGFEGEITVKYCIPWYWHVAEIITYISVVLVLLEIIIKKK